MTVDEWKLILNERIPQMIPTDSLSDTLRDKVKRWCQECLKVASEDDKIGEGAFAACPILCEKNGRWEYVPARLVYLNDDNELYNEFSKDFWFCSFANDFASDAGTYFGLSRISKQVKREIVLIGTRTELPEPIRAQFTNSLPYIWALREHRSRDSGAKLKKLAVQVVEKLEVKLSFSDTERRVHRKWEVDGNIIFLQKGYENDAALAESLALVLDMRSESELYENLIHCRDDDARKQKLLSKNVPEEELGRLLREFDPKNAEPGEAVEVPIRSSAPSPPVTQGELQQQPRPVASQPALPTPSSTPSKAQIERLAGGPRNDQAQAPQPDADPLLDLELDVKDCSSIDYTVGGPPGGVPSERGAASGNGGGPSTGRELTREEKMKLEEDGREIAKLELEKRGYKVEEMPQQNPGYDLRATKDGETLHIEIKSHLSSPNIVEHSCSVKTGLKY